MRYRGGGVGHKYMREIEAKYENMSRERLHGKQRPTPTRANDMDAGDASDSDSEPKDPQPGMSQSQAGVSGPVSGGLGAGEDRNDSNKSDDAETRLSGGDSDEFVDSDEMDSDFGYESYGFADP